VRLDLHVTAPPHKPLVIYDGECNFCAVWVRRWQHTTGDQVDYIPFRDASVAAQFPELSRARFETAVHLVETDGSVYSGAEAAFRALGHGPHEPWLLELYLRYPSFAWLTEASYGFIARHRQLFSFLTRVAWGREVEPGSYVLVRWFFLRSLGVIYLIAFLSLWVQLMGLIGSNGVLPATLTMFGYRQEANMAHLGWHRFHVLPTLCWLSAGDGFLKFQCAAGTGLALVLILGFAPAPCLFLLWLVYLSLSVVSREFLSFQWDNLLLEVGFLAIFFAPLQRRRGACLPPSRLVLWLLRWLLFRLMLCSGLVKLLSGDPAWRNLTALTFHYETQPLPTWVGWYAHQLPTRIQQASTFLMFVIELALPFLIFAPRRVRQVPCAAFILLQFLIFLTGNYCFFNLLSVLLCLVLLDDAAVTRFLPSKVLRTIQPAPQAPSLPQASAEAPVNQAEPVSPNPVSQPKKAAPRGWPIQVTFPLTCVAVLIPAMQFAAMLHVRAPWPGPMITAYSWIAPFRSFNSYGLFAVMTTNRREIIIQGSNDGVHWTDYEFKYKPGDPKRRPGFVEPHQPRLDWQMWFAALSDYQHNLWFVEFCVRLLNGSPQVLGLLQRNPFPKMPPRYLRALVYEYHFTDFATRRSTGAWWRREPKGEYVPVLTAQKGR
jgi:predicted DCC family thiol-disulfide oxidoreductase YuxK